MSNDGKTIRALNYELNHLRQLIIDADLVARARGDDYGLCDEIDNAGQPYQSAWAHEHIERITALGVKHRPRLPADRVDVGPRGGEPMP